MMFTKEKEDASISEQSLIELRRARAWVVMLAVLVFLIAAALCYIGIVNIQNKEAWISGAVTLLVAVFTFLVGKSMVQYVRVLLGLSQSASLLDIERLMRAQSRIWLHLGIVAIIFLVLMVISFFSIMAESF